MLVDQSAAASLAAECLGGVDAVDCIRAREGDSAVGAVAAVAAVETEAEAQRRCAKTKPREVRVSLSRVYAEKKFAGKTHFGGHGPSVSAGVKNWSLTVSPHHSWDAKADKRGIGYILTFACCCQGPCRECRSRGRAPACS